jgi:CRISPR-associated exonuclease Cas4
MNENPISITTLNDFIFCPVSIYFHALYSDINKMTYYSTDQINGLNAHKSVDEGSYPLANTLKSLDVYCEKYNLIGKIDIYNKATKTLTERKKKVNVIYDGYVFQLYAQCFAMREMGYQIEKMIIHSIDDNKNYPIVLPECNPEMLQKFETLINAINNFDLSNFIQTNGEKCGHCIYSPYCDRSVE